MKKFYTSHGRLVTILACMLLFSAAVLAQNTSSVKGTVLDEKGVPLLGVSVSIKGTGFGTVTDSAGQFVLRAAKGAVLVFSYVRYGTQEVRVGDQTTFNLS